MKEVRILDLLGGADDGAPDVYENVAPGAGIVRVHNGSMLRSSPFVVV